MGPTEGQLALPQKAQTMKGEWKLEGFIRQRHGQWAVGGGGRRVSEEEVLAENVIEAEAWRWEVHGLE